MNQAEAKQIITIRGSTLYAYPHPIATGGYAFIYNALLDILAIGDVSRQWVSIRATCSLDGRSQPFQSGTSQTRHVRALDLPTTLYFAARSRSCVGKPVFDALYQFSMEQSRIHSSIPVLPMSPL
jgi:hypothetical protein